jgi:hypothetical protein
LTNAYPEELEGLLIGTATCFEDLVYKVGIFFVTGAITDYLPIGFYFSLFAFGSFF